MEPMTIEIAEKEGYSNVREIEGKGFCGLYRMLFTTGLFYNITRLSVEGRYCFETWADAKEALEKWDGKADPPGNWIKHKGKIEYRNPNLQTEE